MTWLVIAVIAVLGLFFSAFFSGAETGIYCFNRLRLQVGVRQDDIRAARLARVLEDQSGALAVTLIGTNVSNYVTTTAVTFMFVRLIGVSELDAELYTVAALTPIVFVFGEIVPKNLFHRHADALMMQGNVLLAGANRLFRMTGLVWAFTRLSRFALRLATGRHPPDKRAYGSKRYVAALLKESLVDTAQGEDQSELIDRVMQLSETPIHAVMIPRNRVTTVPTSADRRELLRVARRTTHARVPVLQKRGRHVVGVVYLDALLNDDSWRVVEERLQPAVSISPHETVAAAIAVLQDKGQDMAVVTDRGGQMLGLVTMRDLLEELVGELAENT